jgi:hypothetical protein
MVGLFCLSFLGIFLFENPVKKIMNCNNDKNKHLNLQARNERKKIRIRCGGGKRRRKKKGITSSRAMPHGRSTC